MRLLLAVHKVTAKHVCWGATARRWDNNLGRHHMALTAGGTLEVVCACSQVQRGCLGGSCIGKLSLSPDPSHQQVQSISKGSSPYLRSPKTKPHCKSYAACASDPHTFLGLLAKIKCSICSMKFDRFNKSQ